MYVNLRVLCPQTKKYVGELEDTLQWINEFRVEVKANAPFGALPETADKQYEKFVVRSRSLYNLQIKCCNENTKI